MSFDDLIREALRTSSLARKADAIETLLRYCNTGEIRRAPDFRPVRFREPSYASVCRIVDPRELPRRRRFDTPQGQALLLHSIVHIEYSAIDLALDAVYRFPEMPGEFVRDWLIVAEDEVRHFRMLHEILETLGYRYGDFPVHRGLFDVSMHTAGDVLDRMAVVPRHYEATGLDVNPRIGAKLALYRDQPAVSKLLDALEVIYREEIEHVRKGDRWFRWICARRGLEPEETFRRLLDRYGLRKKFRTVINVPARREAGFSCAELKNLGAEKCEE